MKLTKDVIKPGRYRVGEKEFDVTAEQIKGWVDNFNTMRAQNRWVPVPWEHPEPTDEQGLPVDVSDERRRKNRERAKFNAGWVDGLHVSEDGTLQSVLDIPDDTEAERIKNVGTFVSPQFGPYTDPDGTVYDNAITHLALTPRPVNRDQSKEFKPVDAAVALSEPIQFSLDNYVQMGEDDGEEKPAESSEASSENIWSKIKSQLSTLGIEIETSDGELNPEVLSAALATHIATKAKAMEEHKAAKESMDGVQDESAGGDTIAMSEGSEEIDADTSEETTQMSEKTQEQLSRMASAVTESHRKEYTGRISSLLKTGRITAEQSEKLTEAVGTYQFSLDGEDDVQKDLNTRLEIFEALPEGTYWTDEQKVQQMSVEEEDRNTSFWSGGGEISDERAEELASQLQR